MRSLRTVTTIEGNCVGICHQTGRWVYVILRGADMAHDEWCLHAEGLSSCQNIDGHLLIFLVYNHMQFCRKWVVAGRILLASPLSHLEPLQG